MPLDEYKTQVLLLHSEQSTLDNLSSGFNDRYTVHCATSGSEALNTLVDTPINVIITAHDLPGMSGLEALREAKKRSPDTIGILLAGTKTTDIEALVGDEEVFQVVSGNVTGDGLLQLVDKATRQMRLMALAESANDTTAGVDEPAEHIVMETSENGSTIISDGTGRMPVLDPKKVSAAASVGSRSVDILVLTKDQEFLATIKDSSRGMHTVYYANTLAQANEAIREHKIGVAVVDAAMVGEKIEQLTQHLRKGSPRLVSIVAGRRDDGEMLMDLINRGKVYRFLLKPVSPGRARLAVESSVKHHLEGPDSAFRPKGTSAAAAPAPKAVPTPPPPAPAAKPAPEPEPAKPRSTQPDTKLAETSKAKADTKPADKRSIDPPLGSAAANEKDSPINDGLADAFGQDDTSFTETVTGLISSVTKRFSSDSKADSETKPEAKPKAKSTGQSIKGTLDTSPNAANLDNDNSGGSLLNNPKIMGIGAAAVVVVAAGLFWMMSGSDEPSVTPAAISSEPEVAATRDAESADTRDAQPADPAPLDNTVGDADNTLQAARDARDAGRLFAPLGDNAIELYAAALAADPNNAVIAAELDVAVGLALTRAESAMLESRLNDATAALSSVRAAAPDNARLPFLTAQLSQMQLRSYLDDARVAVRQGRFEDAARALAAAEALGTGDSAELNSVRSELRAARNAQQADDVLAKANARLDAGQLLSPPNDNARYYYELVLSNDPDNTAARQGLSVIAGKLAFQARTEIDDGDLTLAENTLANARGIDPQNSEVSAATTVLTNTRAANEERRIAAEAQRVADAEREAQQAAQAEADRLAAAAAAAEEAVAVEERPAVEAQNQQAETTSTDEPAADTSVADSGAAAEPSNAAPTPVVNQAPTAISQFNRTKYVAPKYPRSAARRNLSGWVDIVFTVAIDGTVTDVTVRESSPDDTFVNAAIKAVEKWEFEPVFENGVAVPKRAGVRMMFALE